MMDFQKLDLFLHLAETLNFSTTADALHISQPAVSKAIQNLEDELGFQLFQRGRRYVRLTESGKSFYEDCKHITANMNLAINRARNISQRLSSSLAIGYTGTVLEMQCLPHLVKKLKKKNIQLLSFTLAIPAIRFCSSSFSTGNVTLSLRH
ncbi:LysR family transcriptional regulator [Streptococcus sp. H31]|uniref:LysR family transcriptional regulator n=1 Tax=Streptococcus huangxiaojuni TaxID=3237239 RepID=UPI0034A4061D